jgi:hypothetical protein
MRHSVAAIKKKFQPYLSVAVRCLIVEDPIVLAVIEETERALAFPFIIGHSHYLLNTLSLTDHLLAPDVRN